VIDPESESKILEIVRNVKVQGEDRRVNHVYDSASVKVRQRIVIRRSAYSSFKRREFT